MKSKKARQIGARMAEIENILTGDGQEEFVEMLDEFVGLYDKLKKAKVNPNTPSITTLRGANQKPTLKELQAMVGGYIEVAFSNDEVQIIIDEEGKLKGKPINMEATEHWYTLLETEPKSCQGLTFDEFVRKVDFLVGNVVVLHGNARID